MNFCVLFSYRIKDVRGDTTASEELQEHLCNDAYDCCGSYA